MLFFTQLNSLKEQLSCHDFKNKDEIIKSINKSIKLIETNKNIFWTNYQNFIANLKINKFEVQIFNETLAKCIDNLSSITEGLNTIKTILKVDNEGLCFQTKQKQKGLILNQYAIKNGIVLEIELIAGGKLNPADNFARKPGFFKFHKNSKFEDLITKIKR